ncbi:helix-turn-helix transcriptional regulator [Limosilactobacillus sp. c11Ua_112_M]|uniref:helix-turn-helix domain-containing protein n=1 Tax=Limosilactobacillus portuensis TaxID=2742601 RepID=UPI00178583CA|nr:helix-turn-helix transcriptional regulator [Limosilactobacillus portuensis]MBD8087669.1 helix-turn-helix transcriptional regulator [Limosilactobacillus portuensis]
MTELLSKQQLAKSQGKSLKDVGRESGVGENAIYRWNKVPSKIATLIKVAKALGVDYKLLLP